jgi:hypothetical protein
MYGDHMAGLQNGPSLPTVAAVLPAVPSIVTAVFPVVASVVTAVVTAVPAAVDAVRDDNGAADGGDGSAPASGCKWHISFLPRCRLRWRR